MRVVGHLGVLSKRQVDLAVFPECALTGYCAESHEEACGISLADGLGKGLDDRTRPIQEACSDLGIAAVVGYACNSGSELTNAAALFLPGAGPQVYRKTHLPFLGFDRHATPGGSLAVMHTPWGSIGILICFDMRAPEAARALALQGAELIVLPTNWPEGAEVSADYISIARAAENHVYVATCNRVGVERGFRFIGRSKIIDPDGRILASAGDSEEIIVADVDLAKARDKRVVIIPGRYELDVFGSRRPELYDPLAGRGGHPGDNV